METRSDDHDVMSSTALDDQPSGSPLVELSSRSANDQGEMGLTSDNEDDSGRPDVLQAAGQEDQPPSSTATDGERSSSSPKKQPRGASTRDSPSGPPSRPTEASPPVLRLDSMIPSWFNKVSESSFPSTPKSISMSVTSTQHPDSLSTSIQSSAGPLSESDEQDEIAPAALPLAENLLLDPSTSELVMPSIQMPSRRAFTDRGRAIGSLTVLVTGPKRSGKSSFIKAFAQANEDIVHIDYFPQSQSQNQNQQPQVGSSKGLRAERLKSRTEFDASTCPYPPWWSEEGGAGGDRPQPKKQRRTSSGDDMVLNRNLHFLETRNEGSEDVKSIEDALEQTLHSQRTSDATSLKLLSYNTLDLVDLVCYVTDQEPSVELAEKLKKLDTLSNLVILLTRADTCSAEESDSLKTAWQTWLQAHQISLLRRPPSSTVTSSSATAPTNTTLSIYSISAAPSCDLESMDASLLMSSTTTTPYTPNLTPSDLPLFITQTFSPTTTAYLRHSTARKFISWRREVLHPHSHPHPNPLSSSSSIGNSSSSSGRQLLTFEQYRAREESLASARLRAWSGALQAKNSRERAAFETLARTERATWLLERLNECARDGTMFEGGAAAGGGDVGGSARLGRGLGADGMGFAVDGKGGRKGERGRRTKGREEKREQRRGAGAGEYQGLSRHLARGLVFLQLVGSITVLGGAAIWLARRSGWDGDLIGGF